MTVDATPLDENPYQAPQAASNLITPQSTVEIRGELYERDYDKVLRKPRTVVLMLLSAFLMLAMTALNSPAPLAITLPTLGLSVVLFLFAYRGWRIGSTYVRSFGLHRGDISGQLTAEELELKTESFLSRRNLRHLTFVKITGEAAALSFDSPPSRYYVLPFRVFDDPATGKAILAAAQQNVKKTRFDIFDTRLREPPKTVVAPVDENCIGFAGPVLVGDAKQISNQSNRGLWIKTFLLLNLLPSVFAIFAFTRNPFSPFLVGVTFFIAALVNFRYIRAITQMKRAPETDEVMNVSGWISKESICHSTNIGEGITKWTHYESAIVGDNVIGLEFPGKVKLHAIFARRQFASDNDWERFIAMVREQIEAVKEL
ncbi:MAG: hypothetical protein AAF497_11730 [Planctomycetota bacterium]